MLSYSYPHVMLSRVKNTEASFKVAQKHEAFRQKRNTIWWNWTADFNSFKWEHLTNPLYLKFLSVIISESMKIPDFSDTLVATVWNSFSLSSLKNNFLCYNILDKLYFVTSCTTGCHGCPSPQHSYHPMVFINIMSWFLAYFRSGSG